MQRLDRSVPSYRKDALQRSSFNHSCLGSEISCMDTDQAVDTKTNRLKPRTKNLSNFKATPRNDIMLQGDRYKNVLLENSREEREN
jgi:hypothetical protein